MGYNKNADRAVKALLIMREMIKKLHSEDKISTGDTFIPYTAKWFEFMLTAAMKAVDNMSEKEMLQLVEIWQKETLTLFQDINAA